ncbi:tetratricopeptide repeat protein [Candidatus Marifrigoribacter sp. Uisw_064]|uniref:tetratricopeptide repeat protein n=1 Tax=Candidatus Marifrigoribacter sp. Uisw_064 TaxID=3230970 RepID=UPI003D54A849
MATYKKRGYKPKTKAEKQTELEDDSTTAEVFNTLDESANKTEAWVEKNQKAILIFVGIVSIGVLGYLGYQQFIQEPKEVEAVNDMYQAQQYYEQALSASTKDSLYNLSLNGGEGKYGFLDIIENYGGTNAANLSNYYAGIAYLNTGKYQEAISHLDTFKSDDDMLAPIAKGAIGDAFAQLEQNEQALKYYEIAAALKDNNVTTPRFLLKAGIIAMNLGKTDIALNHFKTITEKYPKSLENTKATLYEGKVEAMK